LLANELARLSLAGHWLVNIKVPRQFEIKASSYLLETLSTAIFIIDLRSGIILLLKLFLLQLASLSLTLPLARREDYDEILTKTQSSWWPKEYAVESFQALISNVPLTNSAFWWMRILQCLLPVRYQW